MKQVSSWQEERENGASMMWWSWMDCSRLGQSALSKMGRGGGAVTRGQGEADQYGDIVRPC